MQISWLLHHHFGTSLDKGTLLCAPGSIPRQPWEIVFAVNMGKAFDKNFTFWTGFISATFISSPQREPPRESAHMWWPTKNWFLPKWHSSLRGCTAGSTTHPLSCQTARPLSWHCPIYSLLIRWQEAAFAPSSTCVTTQPHACRRDSWRTTRTTSSNSCSDLSLSSIHHLVFN